MLDSLRLTPRKMQLGCGIYEAGDTEVCYTKLFVTDRGRCLPLNHRAITEDDLLLAYEWGRAEATDDEKDSKVFAETIGTDN